MQIKSNYISNSLCNHNLSITEALGKNVVPTVCGVTRTTQSLTLDIAPLVCFPLCCFLSNNRSNM